jgi:hypothetical protein
VQCSECASLGCELIVAREAVEPVLSRTRARLVPVLALLGVVSACGGHAAISADEQSGGGTVSSSSGAGGSRSMAPASPCLNAANLPCLAAGLGLCPAFDDHHAVARNYAASPLNFCPDPACGVCLSCNHRN